MICNFTKKIAHRRCGAVLFLLIFLRTYILIISSNHINPNTYLEIMGNIFGGTSRISVRIFSVLFGDERPTSDNIQLCIDSQYSSQQLTIVWSLIHHSTQPILIFSSVRVLHLDRLKEGTWLHIFVLAILNIKPNRNKSFFF